MSFGSSLRYEAIGSGYAQTRREDARVAALIDRALGDARSVVNVGAGTGSYEPRDRHVIAIEPSDVMARQRPPGLAPAIAASAGQLPLRDDSVDAAMAVLTVHHWDADQERGVRELSRVARDTVVIVTYDPEVHGSMWLMADYLPEVANLDLRTCPRPEQIVAWLGGGAEVQTIKTTRDTPDWALGSFWAHRSACSTLKRAKRPRGSRAWTRRSSTASSTPSRRTSAVGPGIAATDTYVKPTPSTSACA